MAEGTIGIGEGVCGSEMAGGGACATVSLVMAVGGVVCFVGEVSADDRSGELAIMREVLLSRGDGCCCCCCGEGRLLTGCRLTVGAAADDMSRIFLAFACG